jgi:hypothetical protein
MWPEQSRHPFSGVRRGAVVGLRRLRRCGRLRRRPVRSPSVRPERSRRAIAHLRLRAVVGVRRLRRSGRVRRRRPARPPLRAQPARPDPAALCRRPARAPGSLPGSGRVRRRPRRVPALWRPRRRPAVPHLCPRPLRPLRRLHRRDALPRSGQSGLPAAAAGVVQRPGRRPGWADGRGSLRPERGRGSVRGGARACAGPRASPGCGRARAGWGASTATPNRPRPARSAR